MIDIKETIKYTKELVVLYVEDDAPLRENTKELFENYFKSVDTAVDGKDGFECYDAYHQKTGAFYDIVITDLQMPEINGVKLTKMILDYHPQQEIIVTSAHDSSSNIIKLVNLGISKFIPKPLIRDELNKILFDVAQKLRKRKLKDEEKNELDFHNKILQDREDASRKQFNEYYDALNESNIISRSDSKGTITFVNKQFCDITGYSEEELIGKNYHLLKNPASTSSYYTKLWNTIRNKETFQSIFQNRRKDGSTYYIEQLIKPIVDLNGEIVEYITIAHDVTKLFHSIEKEKDAKKSKDQFFRNVGHEMRTPLNAIIGITPFIRKSIKDDARLFEMLDVVDESSQKLHKLIENVLHIQKLQGGELKVSDQSFNPITALEELVRQREKSAALKEQEIKIIMDKEELPFLMGDEKYIMQIIETLIENAIKFSPNNSTIIISMTYDQINKKLKISVKDNGIGISEENQQLIFTGTQADGSMTRQHEGAGLGLLLASNLVELLNGKITVKSDLNKGSLFLVEIPCELLD